MSNDEFDKLLKLAKLNRKEFAEINGLNSNTVSNWKTRGFPMWVKPWLENYIKAKIFDSMIDTAEQLKK
jgi:hypothetical protein